MIGPLAAALLGPFVTTFLLLNALIPCRGFAAHLTRAGAALGLSFGFTSMTFFLWRLGGGAVIVYPLVEAVGLAAVCLAILIARRRAPKRQLPGGLLSEGMALRVAAIAFVLVAVAFGVVLLRQKVLAVPHGEWDAWAMWNLRAAFLSSPSDDWKHPFGSGTGLSHPEYPLLIPASVARLWVFIGNQSPVGPIAVAVALLAATTAICIGTLLPLAGAAAAALATALLLAPDYLFFTASQCADTAVSLFLLLAIALLSTEATPGRIACAGLAAGFAAWSKNEGLVAALAVVAACALVSAVRDGFPKARARTGWLLVGLVIPVTVLAIFRSFAASSELLGGISATGPLAKLQDIERHRLIFDHMNATFLSWGGWQALGVTPALLVILWNGLGVLRTRSLSPSTLIGWLAIAAMLLAYYAVYLISPYDLTWHLQTSWVRLISQIWPAMVWTAASALTTASSSEAHVQ